MKRRRSRSLSCHTRRESPVESRAPQAPYTNNLSLSPPTSKSAQIIPPCASEVPSVQPKVREPSPTTKKDSKTASQHQPRTPYDTVRRCYECNSTSHLRNTCPKLSAQRRAHVKRIPDTKDTVISKPSIFPKFTAAVKEKGKVYITIQAGPRLAVALLDTGCAHSICGRNVIPRTVLDSTERKMYTANGAHIPILGETTIHFRVRGAPHTARVAVTDAISEIILGIDWLENNVKDWNFETGKVRIGDTWIPLTDGNSVDQHYQILVKEDIVIPA